MKNRRSFPAAEKTGDEVGSGRQRLRNTLVS